MDSELAVDFISWRDQRGRRHDRRADEFDRTALIGATQIRRGPYVRHRGSYQGQYACAQTLQHVWYESLLEMRTMRFLDLRDDIWTMISQPLQLQIPDASTHVPDILVGRTNGSWLLVDVKHRAGIERSAHVFNETARICRTIGIDYEVHTDLEPAVDQNATWLRGFAHERFEPSTELRQTITELAAQPIRFDDLISRSGHPSYAVSPHVFWLMFHRQLRFDIKTPLSRATYLRTTDDGTN